VLAGAPVEAEAKAKAGAKNGKKAKEG